MSAADLPTPFFLGVTVVVLLAAYTYQLLWGAHSSRQQRFGPSRNTLAQRRSGESTSCVDEVPARTSATKPESELQSIITGSPRFRGQPDAFVDSSIDQGGSSYNGNPTLHGGSLHQGNVVNIHQTDDQCVSDLRVTDPRHDKTRIQDSKGGLLKGSCDWVLKNPDFCKWRNNEEKWLLWIKGDPGKGKTMLLCGIIDELSIDRPRGRLLSYFFCQANDKRLNTATAVVRGLIFMLLCQDPSLVPYLKNMHDTAGRALFEDANAWQALCEIFTNILKDPKLQGVCLVIDALDECVADQQQLLRFIVETSRSTYARWLISSRNWVAIDEELCNVAQKLSLEVNKESVAATVEEYIKHNVRQLAKQKDYRSDTEKEVRQHLLSNAMGTFLWVALVCQELEKTDKWGATKQVKKFPSGLDNLYDRMIQQIRKSRRETICCEILALVTTTYRPLSILEMTSFIDECDGMSDSCDFLEMVVAQCGSFLMIRNKIVYLVHQSAKDFLLEAQSTENTARVHRKIFFKSIDAMSPILKRDIHELRNPGYVIESNHRWEDRSDPQATIRYSCVHWINHLVDAISTSGQDNIVEEDQKVQIFIQSKGLYWIESLSLLQSISEGMLALQRLIQYSRGQSTGPGFQALVNDIYRLLQMFRPAIERRPLQTYASALIFSPSRSLIRDLFSHEAPAWVKCKTEFAGQWSACEATFEGHTNWVRSAAFSPDGQRIVSASDDSTVKIWSVQAGACEATFEGHTDSVRSAAFSPDGQRIVSASNDNTVKVWSVQTGTCEATFEGHTDSVRSAAFSPDGQRIVSASNDNTVKVWSVQTGACEATFEGRTGSVRSAAFSPDGQYIVSASYDNTVKVWSVQTGTCEATFEGHTHSVISAAFSPDGQRIVSASDDNTVKVWSVQTSTCEATFEGHTHWVMSAAFSPDGQYIVSASYDNTVKVWSVQTGTCEATFEGHTDSVMSAAFSPDGQRIVSASNDNTVKVWSVQTGTCEATFEGHTHWVMSAAFSLDGQRIVTASEDNTVKVWSVQTGTCEATFEGHTNSVMSAAFSPDGQHIVSASYDNTVKVWSIQTGACEATFGGHTSKVSFDASGTLIQTDNRFIRLDDAKLPKRALPTYSVDTMGMVDFCFSPDNTWIQYQSQSVLWIPPEYRPVWSAVVAVNIGTTIAAGCSSGRVYTYHFPANCNMFC
ncbi:dynein assembly factor with WDR repeat domains 1 [Microdochium nivale]|nr:dynein assembly factor with WDR repeat domains 1 [Microdochium nivale]